VRGDPVRVSFARVINAEPESTPVAAPRAEEPAIEGKGLTNFRAHTNGAESINVSSIVPRPYLLT
jgi:hypothetical protein